MILTQSINHFRSTFHFFFILFFLFQFQFECDARASDDEWRKFFVFVMNDTHLPRNAAENQEHSIIEILAIILRFEGADPVDLGRCDGAHRRIGHSERNADPLKKNVVVVIH